MPQLNPSQARVVDPIITNVARGFSFPGLIASALFPTVGVAQRGGRILTFGVEDFLLYNTGRAPGSNTKRMSFGHFGAPYALESHSLEGVVPIELMQEAQAVPGIDMGAGAVRKVRNAMLLRLEYQAAQLARNAANYGAGNKVTKSGTGQWSDLAASDPIGDVENAKEVIRAATGMRGNTVVMGAAAFKSIKQHKSVIDRIKYTGRDVPTLELLASLFDVQRVVVGDAVYSTGGGTNPAFVDVWGKDVVVAYTDTASAADMGTPSYGYTYQLDGYMVVEEPYFDRNSKSWVYPVTDEVAPVIAGASAGYLIQNAVA
ncbi:MAG: major capsid protein [Burkholderiaceae bacterium]